MNRKVECSINEGQRCIENFCKYIYFQRLTKEYFDLWIKQCQKELDDYRREAIERKILGRLVK